jgi:DNA-binding MarR family transcriptional regulator
MTLDIGRELEKCGHIHRLKLDEALAGLKLTAPQYRVLAALPDEPGLSAAALARRCFVSPQTMTGIVANLIKASLIAREPDPDHGRILKTRLTVRGRDLLRQAHRAAQEVEERMAGELDRAERDALADLLSQCAGALGGKKA